ncbi:MULTISPECIES: DUF6530 family protein [Enterobacteriaceae]|uniref:DUF6530 family protein n=1 Tax=Enterobacteriaceae TaxID=543 RepID=UPI00086320B8|nr:DUF6530 family protein [Klebsiella sp. LTGPAF-6F]AOV09987.1 hypothetical protein BJF97_02645 [Klebsiella sp. LTGPAF-6F]
MDIPTHLSHRPVVKLENYSAIDGQYKNNTDAEGLSIGIAQWSEPDSPELSAKVWRYTGMKWSRQSEELPVHRVLDLANLICAALSYVRTGVLPVDKRFRITLANNPELISTMKACLEKDSENIDTSLSRLAESLKAILPE